MSEVTVHNDSCVSVEHKRARSVGCPACGAPKYESCKNAAGQVLADSHVERIGARFVDELEIRARLSGEL